MNQTRESAVAVEPAKAVKPRALLFGTLSAVWIFPTITSLVILFSGGWPWKGTVSFLSGLERVALEQWLGALILLLHPLFGWLAFHYFRTEKPRVLPPEPEDASAAVSSNKL